MSNGEQKNFLNFIKDVTENQQLAQNFLKVFNDVNTTAEDLHKFMNGSGYGGVSLEDSQKMLAVKAAAGTVDIDGITVKY